MKVRLLYFAAVRELLGIEAESITLPDHVTTVEALVRWLQEEHEPLRGRLANVRIARNETFAQPSEALADGDMIALIPPVAGG